MAKYLLVAVIALALLGGCKEDQSTGNTANPKIYHTDQPRESVPECPTWILLAAGGGLILAHFKRYGA
jgi:type IV pilus biogenesis protein CpaD/CtpE